MSVYVDTSALYAVLDADDAHHTAARQVWTDLLTEDADLVCTNYVLVETFALVQHRLGIAAVRVLQEDVLPIVRVEWVTAEHHAAAVAALLTAARPQLSLVDCTSFEVMRRLGIRTAFALDGHFADQGFECLPPA